MRRKSGFTGFAVEKGGWEIGPWRAKPIKDANPDIPLAGKAPAKDRFEVAIPTYTPKDEKRETIPLHELAARHPRGHARGMEN